jgi:hypothetical protein
LRGKYLGKVLKSRWLTTGPMCERLKEALAEKFEWEKDRIALANSATACWQALLDDSSGLVTQREDTFVSMKDAEADHGVSPSLDSFTHVHTFLGGLDAEPAWPAFSTEVADCTHIGHPWKDADYSLLSFYPTKPIPGAEGGAMFCWSKEAADNLSRLVDCGFSGQPRNYETRVWGRKANMTDVQAALALEALELSEGYMDGLREAWGRMALDCPGDFNYVDVSDRPYLFQLVLPEGVKVPEVQKRLSFPTGWHFPPNRRLTLPLFSGMTDRVIHTMFKEIGKLEIYGH